MKIHNVAELADVIECIVIDRRRRNRTEMLLDDLGADEIDYLLASDLLTTREQIEAFARGVVDMMRAAP